MRNLPSSIGLLALVMELLCSRFRMSWIRCSSVLIGVCSLLSPGMVRRKACVIRPVPCSVAADDVDGDHAGGGGATTCFAVGFPGGGGGGSLASLDMNECEIIDL